MKIIFELKESIYNCQVQIRDSQGSRSFLLDATEDSPVVEVELSRDAQLIFLPVIPENKMGETTWKDRLAKKAATKLGNLLYDFFLRVGCRFQCAALQDGDRLNVRLQTYLFGPVDRWQLLELYPMMYMFFEIDKDGHRLLPESAWALNRKEVIRRAKTISFLELFDWGFLFSLLRRPIQVGRIKYLSKDKTANRKIKNFSQLTEEDRKRFLEKQERFIKD